MEVIALQHPHSYKREDFPAQAMALGFFDGLHLGHQKVIQTAMDYAKKHHLQSAVMTFEPHPSVVLGKSVKHVALITPLDEKIKQMEIQGVDRLFVVQFTELFSSLDPQSFVDEYIIGLHVMHAVAGFDFSYGRLGKGSMETLPFHSREQFSQTIVEKLTNAKDEKVSSTAIRGFILEGDMEKTYQFLSRAYSVQGTVVHGQKRGRLIGFPTANIKVEDNYLLPPVGVYAVKVNVDDKWHNGVCNFGRKPTFEDGPYEPQAEVHLFDFSGDLYGKSLKVEWYKRLRDEKKFENVDELIEQIKKDAQQAEAYFHSK